MPVEERELVIIGGGPAGLSAAVEARALGVDVVLIDERPALGGQIYKQFPKAFGVEAGARLGSEYEKGRRLIESAVSSGADIRLQTVAWGVWGQEVATCREGGEARVIAARRIILAPGAYDRPVVLPGWTLPGVMTAGAAQSIVKIQRVLPGRRIVMAGSGALVLAFAAQLHRLGANVVAVAEAAPFPRPRALASLLLGAYGSPGALVDGLRYATYLRRSGVPFFYSHALVRVEGSREAEAAILSRVDSDWRPVAGTERRIEADTVCLGYGFFPSVELSRLCGCEHFYDETLGGYVPVRDQRMHSTVPGILVAGDGGGVAGAMVATIEGRIAGITAAHETGRLGEVELVRRLRPLQRRLGRLLRFRTALDSTYAVGSGIYELAEPDTVVCRCESVTAGEVLNSTLAGSIDPNSVKALTRAGMGGCQGRNCARQVASLMARRAGVDITEVPLFTPRPPVKLLPLGTVAQDVPDDAIGGAT